MTSAVCRPALQETKSYDELTTLLKNHYQAKPLVIAKRFYFGQRNQKEGKTIADYIAELRRLSANCDYGDFLTQAFHNHLVAGIQSEVLQQQLLSKETLTLDEAVKISQGFKAAELNVKALKCAEPAASTVGRLNTKPVPKPAVPCYRCGRGNHSPDQCKLKKC